MRQVVDEVLKTEEQAQEIVKSARREAAKIKNVAGNEIAEKVKNARIEAQSSIRDKVAKAREQAGKEYQQAVEDTKQSIERYMQLSKEEIDSIVKKIVQFIILPKFRR